MQKTINQRTISKIVIMLLTVILMSSTYINCNADEAAVVINESNFPNSFFRKYISEHIDEDTNGVLSQREMSKVRKIELWRVGKDYVDAYDQIDLKGINYFTN